jgi:prepilin-type N-terminal cleavage/methylation domain-containing protein
MKSGPNRSAFTLTEVMIATALSAIALGGTIMLFISCLRGIRAGVADLMLARGMQIVQENIVRGVSSQAGLRSCNWSNIVVGPVGNGVLLTFNVDTNDWPTPQTNDDVYFTIQTNGGCNYYRQLPGSPSTLLGGLVSSNFTLQSLAFQKQVTSTGNVLIASVTLSFSTAGKTYTRNHTITTRIPNN